MSRAELLMLEAEIDRRVASLPILQLPIRPVLLGIDAVLHKLAHGDRGRGLRPDSSRLESLAGRLAYLLPMLQRCPGEPTGTNAAEAMEALLDVDPTGEQLQALVQYAHLCELFPAVHRRQYEVVQNDEWSFSLHHPSSEFARYEATDILLSELALPSERGDVGNISSEVERIARTLPKANADDVVSVLSHLADHFYRNVVERSVVDAGTLAKAIGTSLVAFKRFRALAMALATFAGRIAESLAARLYKEPGRQGLLQAEWLEWVSLCWSEDYVLGLFRGVAGVDDSALERLLAIFSLDFRISPVEIPHGGDGFCPPFVRLPGGVIQISPEIARLMLHTRNIAYALQGLNPRFYDEAFSDALEPELLREATARFSPAGGGYLIRELVSWEHGEADLLVLQEHSGDVMHLQAKGSVAPHGVRMSERLGKRVDEGVRQIETFRRLPADRRSAILENAFGRPATGAVVDALLTSACFGTEQTWLRLGDIAPLTLPVLAAVLGEAPHARLAELPGRARQWIRSYVDRARPRWSQGSIEVCGLRLEMPLLSYDRAYVAMIRNEVSGA